MLKYAIGDTHGCLDHLDMMLEKIEKNAEGELYQLIFLGDYIDRGPDSKGVIDRVREQKNAITLRGNHEQMMLMAHRDPSEQYLWMTNGGTETLKSFGELVPDDYLRWCTQLKWYHEDEHRIYVHAGIIPGIKMELQTTDDRFKHELIWIREPFLFAKWPHPTKLVVHGHTPQKVIFHDWKETGRVNLDTGGVFFGKLSAAKFNDEEKFPLEILEVKGAVPPRYR